MKNIIHLILTAVVMAIILYGSLWLVMNFNYIEG